MHLGAGVIDTASLQTNTTMTTGVGSTRILLAGASLALAITVFVGLTGAFAGIVDAGSVAALLASGAVHIVTRPDASTIQGAANLSGVALYVVARVGAASAVLAEVCVAGTLGVLGRASWLNTQVE